MQPIHRDRRWRIHFDDAGNRTAIAETHFLTDATAIVSNGYDRTKLWIEHIPCGALLPAEIPATELGDHYVTCRNKQQAAS